MLERIEALAQEGIAAVDGATSTEQLESVRVHYLGRKAELPNMLRGVAELPPEQRGAVGKRANAVRQDLEQRITAAHERLEHAELDARLVSDRVDITLPGTPPSPVGRRHLITQTMREVEDVFVGLGFTVMEGPEVELVELNFDALNHSPTHPARDRTDTFYVSDDVVLRTHTSPMQIRAMREFPPPLYVVIPGRVYRRDSDATHTPQFHQVEGLAVDDDVTLADLKGTLLAFSRAIFGDTREVRLRGHFFPFTEPSVEVDVSCFACTDGWIGATRCHLCKGEGWIEVLGAGEVDPNVFAAVGDERYDPDRVKGFAWGMGIERIAFLKHGVSDLRLFYENDVRFLRQFG